MKKGHILIFIILIFSGVQGVGQTYQFETSKFVYKEIGGISLEMTMYKPILSSHVNLPAIVFFFGGGWVGGTPEQFKLQAEYFASRGVIVICPDYRVKSRQGTTPFDCVKDANSAMRYLRTNWRELGIDSDKIIAAGGSAGGHLAACTATIKECNETDDDLSVSTKPMAMVLFNPVVDTGKRGYGQEKLEGREFEISPVHHITAGIAPTLIMHGKDDTTVPYENVARFTSLMKQVGNKCRLKDYKHQKHGFFNYRNNPKYFKKTLIQTERFLDELNLLRGESWVKKYCKELG
ncbi:alpha/beta hydrolase fold domain-containing protein [Prolixibacteraceae bacterium Z1-6]|uniref:Alpha/beta hydrolase fold domain-containing protein n=1 Tax=Draconibacterium aestuarii TaxID=2998507 RepID=A0A9X3J5C7_9BACT|nr:alpha/beta hydrolase fold domain-containing protein [Prolixibacteraceae bacterium Z1-6]